MHMIKQLTVIFVLISSLDVLAADPVITSDASNQQPTAQNGPVVNMGSPPQDTIFSFGSNKTQQSTTNNRGLAGAVQGAHAANLFSYESVISRPEDTDGDSNNNTSMIINAGVEAVTSSNFSYHGGFSFIVQDSFKTAFNAGLRFYSGMPMLNMNTPTYSYIGVGMLFVNGSTFSPEVGIRLAPSNSMRVDIYFKAYTSSDEEYDGLAVLGLGLSF